MIVESIGVEPTTFPPAAGRSFSLINTNKKGPHLRTFCGEYRGRTDDLLHAITKKALF